MPRIEARVAKILSERELVLNKGEAQGVRAGMRFAILNSRGGNIIDPDSGEILGSVELEKTVVKVVRTQENLSVARTFRTFKVGGGPLSFSMFAEPETRTESLRTDESRLRDELNEEDSFVKTGDVAVQIVGDEFTDSAA